MIKTVGSEWLDIGAPAKFRENIGLVIEKNQKEKSEAGIDRLIYADFITLAHFFTAPYSLKSDLKGLFKELQKFADDEKLKKGQDGDNACKEKSGIKKSDLFTSEILDKLSDEYEAKNNWDRYFSDKLSVKSKGQFSKKWSELYEYRNAVAHGKIICRADYDKTVSWQICLKRCLENV